MGYGKPSCGPAAVARRRSGEAAEARALHLRAGRIGAAGADRAAGRRRDLQHGDRREGRGHRTTVIAWRARYTEAGIAGLADHDRSGRPRRIDHRAIVTATLRPPPKKLGVTHCSSRLLASRLGIDHSTVAKAWREYGVAPWREGTFKFSTDPELVAKVVDVVGLYLAPPENAVVLCLDEKSQIQALERTSPRLPMQPGKAGGAHP